jgi:hypothetical protein
MMSRGGLRAGAGRPPEEERKLSVIIRLRQRVATHLRATIPEKTRSEWIEKLIVAALKKHQESL